MTKGLNVVGIIYVTLVTLKKLLDTPAAGYLAKQYMMLAQILRNGEGICENWSLSARASLVGLNLYYIVRSLDGRWGLK